MKKILIFTLILILSSYAEITFAQSEIWLLDGKKIKTDTIIFDSTDVIIYKSKKEKYKYFMQNEVFSTKQNNETKYFYKQDTTEGSFSLPEMTDYMQGQFDGKNHKSPAAFSGGVAIGIITPLIFPVIGIPTVFSPIVPAGYTLAIGIPKVKEKNMDIPKQYKNNQHYKFGYQRIAKKKKITNAILGSTIGLVIGLGAAFFIFEGI